MKHTKISTNATRVKISTIYPDAFISTSQLHFLKTIFGGVPNMFTTQFLQNPLAVLTRHGIEHVKFVRQPNIDHDEILTSQNARRLFICRHLRMKSLIIIVVTPMKRNGRLSIPSPFHHFVVADDIGKVVVMRNAYFVGSRICRQPSHCLRKAAT